MQLPLTNPECTFTGVPWGHTPRYSGEESRPCPHRGGGVSRRGSANHLVRLEEEGRGNREAERLGRLEVDDQLELRRLLHGQVGGLALSGFLST